LTFFAIALWVRRNSELKNYKRHHGYLYQKCQEQ